MGRAIVAALRSAVLGVPVVGVPVLSVPVVGVPIVRVQLVGASVVAASIVAAAVVASCTVVTPTGIRPAVTSPAVTLAWRPAPDEELLGKSRGYPVGTRATWYFDETVRVGSFSNLDRILPHRVLHKSEAPLPLGKSSSEPLIRYSFRGRDYALDDKAADYVPELADNAYGQTSLRDLLRMSSGVRFTEDYSGNDDSAKFGRALTSAHGGMILAIRQFNEREAPAGTRFNYASIETNVLGLVLIRATGRRVSDYVTEKIWQPMGAENDATWIIAPDGNERFAGAFNATLRDWGRLGVLLANDGAREGKAIVPLDYLLDATDWRKQPAAFAPKGRGLGYGYQFWTFGGESRRFALLGVYGQAIYVDPQLKLVMVHTAAAKNPRIGNESMGPELRALWVGIVESLGRPVSAVSATAPFAPR